MFPFRTEWDFAWDDPIELGRNPYILREVGATQKASVFSAKSLQELEARVGIEPTYKGFADLSLTTWVPRRIE